MQKGQATSCGATSYDLPSTELLGKHKVLEIIPAQNGDHKQHVSISYASFFLDNFQVRSSSCLGGLPQHGHPQAQAWPNVTLLCPSDHL